MTVPLKLYGSLADKRIFCFFEVRVKSAKNTVSKYFLKNLPKRYGELK